MAMNRNKISNVISEMPEEKLNNEKKLNESWRNEMALVIMKANHIIMKA